jgi:hypothetical protein
LTNGRWGDSNLYMRRRGAQLTLSTEYMAAAFEEHIPLQLMQCRAALAFCVASDLTDGQGREAVIRPRVRRAGPG